MSENVPQIRYVGPNLETDTTLAELVGNPHHHLEIVADFGEREIHYRAVHEADANSTPAREWHGHARSWIVPIMTRSDAEAVVGHLRPLVAKACAGYTDEWDGSNQVARFTDDAREALDEIGMYLDDLPVTGRLTPAGGLWDAADWLQAEPPEVSPVATDAELEALAGELQDAAHYEGVHVHDLEEYLQARRDELQAEPLEVFSRDDYCVHALWALDNDEIAACVGCPEHARATADAAGSVTPGLCRAWLGSHEDCAGLDGRRAECLLDLLDKQAARLWARFGEVAS